MIRRIIFFLTLFLSFFTLLSDNIFVISEVNFYVLLAIIVLDYIDKKSLSFFQVWIIGFIFIIVSEALLIWPGHNILKAVKYLLFANQLVIFGYLVPFKHYNLRQTLYYFNNVNTSRWTPYVLIALLIFYIIYSLPGALLAFSVGRNAASDIESNLIISSLSKSVGLILPSISIFYYKEVLKKKSIIRPLLISLPIFLILFIDGTRFPLLFSAGGFLIILQSTSDGKIKFNLKFIILILILVASSFLMGEFRSSGLKHGFSREIASETHSRLSQRLASEMSPEGVVDQTAMMMTHFENNPHTHGKSILFLTYFWVPRSIWPDKPTMLGHWLIREYRTGFSEGHSSSFGFTGELYADFGYFSLLVVFLLGLLLNRADLFRFVQLSKKQSYKKVLVAMIFSYVFFFVRSPITSTMTFLGVLLVYFVIQKMLFKTTRLTKQESNRSLQSREL